MLFFITYSYKDSVCHNVIKAQSQRSPTEQLKKSLKIQFPLKNKIFVSGFFWCIVFNFINGIETIFIKGIDTLYFIRLCKNMHNEN